MSRRSGASRVGDAALVCVAAGVGGVLTGGVRPWARLRVIVDRRLGGSIPVGEAVAVSTGMAGVAYVIAAPVQARPLFAGGRVQSDDHGWVVVPHDPTHLMSPGPGGTRGLWSTAA